MQRQKPEEESRGKMKGYGKHGQLINLLPCKGEESTLLSALCFFIDRIIAEKRVRDRSV